MRSRWRDHSRKVIAAVLSETQGQDEAVIVRALREAYPFGPKENHPYSIWLSEIKRQRGQVKPKVKESPASDPLQITMFDEAQETNR